MTGMGIGIGIWFGRGYGAWPTSFFHLGVWVWCAWIGWIYGVSNDRGRSVSTDKRTEGMWNEKQIQQRRDVVVSPTTIVYTCHGSNVNKSFYILRLFFRWC
ncbi:hypothetical protein IWX90DRAFT_98353 [Phyllosticta citrichinensis]|uniref:Transmembrane protein n=1 Tax=Phyllosticta citrichinensis TaxID=1130410 RepID=A0ABR1Y203_9PEZI